MKIQLLLGLALLWSGCGLAQTEAAADTREVVAGNMRFALDLYGKLRTQEGNVFCSPYSISAALAMTCGGARGETEKQMVRTLHFDLPADKLHPAFAGLEAGLRAVEQKGRVQLAEANSLWPQRGFALLPDYLAFGRKYYGTSITPVDYSGNTEGARKTINEWVEGRTNRKITELLPPGVLDGSTRLVLVNAIYFKGNWAGPFEPGSTGNEPFYTAPQKSALAPLMRQTGDFGYAEFPGLQMLELPYAGGDLAMLVLLPREADGLAGLETELTPPHLAAWTAALQSRRVMVFLPKFKMTSAFSLAETLTGLGMPEAFISGRADFSGMDGRHDLYISAVLHKAFVEVNEEGSEAAAATAVLMNFGGAPAKMPPATVFRADHPFLFLIRDTRNGSILFLGRLTDPAK